MFTENQVGILDAVSHILVDPNGSSWRNDISEKDREQSYVSLLDYNCRPGSNYAPRNGYEIHYTIGPVMMDGDVFLELMTDYVNDEDDDDTMVLGCVRVRFDHERLRSSEISRLCQIIEMMLEL